VSECKVVRSASYGVQISAVVDVIDEGVAQGYCLRDWAEVGESAIVGS